MAIALAREKFKVAEAQVNPFNKISTEAHQRIQTIISGLGTADRDPSDRPRPKGRGFRKSYAKAFVEFRSELCASTEQPTILPSHTIGLTTPKPKEATPSLRMLIAALWSLSRYV